jgi:hypothetical protein
MGIFVGRKRETDPLCGLVIVLHDGSYPMGVVEHPFDEEVYGIKLGKHGNVMPISELWRICIRSWVCLWRTILVWLVLWLLVDLVF